MMTHQSPAKLASLTQEAWEQLDIHAFIARHHGRYIPLLLRRIKSLPSDAGHALPGMFSDIAYVPMTKVHAKHLDATGDRRDQIMLGTLKKIALTRMMDALLTEFPTHQSLDDLLEHATNESSIFEQEHAGLLAVGDDPDETMEVTHAQLELEQIRIVEMARPILTATQYECLRMNVIDRMSIREIAVETGTTETNVRVIMMNARRRLQAVNDERYVAHKKAGD